MSGILLLALVVSKATSRASSCLAMAVGALISSLNVISSLNCRLPGNADGQHRKAALGCNGRGCGGQAPRGPARGRWVGRTALSSMLPLGEGERLPSGAEELG